jgi:MarR family transcriptional regulator, transcriptional regulator for hemolysin
MGCDEGFDADDVLEFTDPSTVQRRLFMQLGSLLHDVSRLRRRLYDDRTRPLGITRSQWWVLWHLSRRRGKAPIQAELAQVLEIGTPAAGDLVGRLEKAGFVHRQPDARDRRSMRIQIAPAGRAVLDQMATVATVNNEAVMTGFTNEEAETLLTYLERMKRNLVQIAAGETPVD